MSIVDVCLSSDDGWSAVSSQLFRLRLEKIKKSKNNSSKIPENSVFLKFLAVFKKNR